MNKLKFTFIWLQKVSGRHMNIDAYLGNSEHFKVMKLLLKRTSSG